MKFFFCMLGLMVFAPIVGMVALLNIAIRPTQAPAEPEPDPIGDDPGVPVDLSSPA